MVVPLLVTVTVSMNWRYSFYILAIQGIILAIILMFYMREPILRSTKGAAEKTTKLTFADYKSVFKTRKFGSA